MSKWLSVCTFIEDSDQIELPRRLISSAFVTQIHNSTTLKFNTDDACHAWKSSIKTEKNQTGTRRSQRWFSANSTPPHPLGKLFQMVAQNQKFSEGLNKPLQLSQSWSQFEQITTYLLDHWAEIESWCAPLSFPYFCAPVNHGPWLQS